MNLGKSFESSKDFQLNKITFVNLRWVALLGQFAAINVVKFVFQFDFYFLVCNFIVGIGVLINLFLQFQIKQNQLNNNLSTIYLTYDIVQLGTLIYLTGGVTNPFIFLLIFPSVFSSIYLKLSSTINLVVITIFIIIILTFFHFDLPSPMHLHFHVPDYYLYAIPLAIIIGLIFLVYFGSKFGEESRKRKEALDNIQNVMAKEHELSSLGAQAAAAAHSLGTPLSTISLVIKELKEELKGNNKLEKEIDLLISQSERCNQILKKLSMNPQLGDEFIGFKASFQDYLSEIIRAFQEISKKNFFFNTTENKNSIKFKRSIEINYGLRNFIGNANKFSKQKVEVKLISDEKNTEIQISDDGPGFPNDIIDKLGEPYIISASQENKLKTGLGLGTFIGKTLLEKNYGKINFKNTSKMNGALVNISWLNTDLKRI
ncbi:MAG: ActS/PrrB/RegB family redox-sensitive histidine kinase [Pelagibacteraceae bacterium]|nr:ActS/PrrB/RegB family redox-sensitive histidine kinase [Pelagibacteraceae bacterium]